MEGSQATTMLWSRPGYGRGEATRGRCVAAVQQAWRPRCTGRYLGGPGLPRKVGQLLAQRGGHAGGPQALGRLAGGAQRRHRRLPCRHAAGQPIRSARGQRFRAEVATAFCSTVHHTAGDHLHIRAGCAGPHTVAEASSAGSPGPSRMAAAKPGGSSLLSSSMTRGPCSGCAAKRPSSDAVAACSVCCVSCAGGDSLPEQLATRGCSVQQTWSSLMLPYCRNGQRSVLSVRDCVKKCAPWRPRAAARSAAAPTGRTRCRPAPRLPKLRRAWLPGRAAACRA